MIRDLGLTLEAILSDPSLAADFPELAAAQIAFDRPSENFAPTSPTIDLFLYDIRENLELRSNEPDVELVDGVYTLGRPPLRVACSYLLTAWPVGGGDLPLQEHRLLGQALQVMARYPLIPSAFLRGKLVGQEPPLPMMTARHEGIREPHEFWAAIGNRMRASVMLTVTIGMEVFAPVHAPEVIASQIRIGERLGPDIEKLVPNADPPRFRIGGRVTRAATNAAVADASVRIVELGVVSRTDAEGRYELGAMAAGSYTLRAEQGPDSQQITVAVPPAPGKRYDLAL